jgi:hypothetical protein
VWQRDGSAAWQTAVVADCRAQTQDKSPRECFPEGLRKWQEMPGYFLPLSTHPAENDKSIKNSIA